MSVVHASDHLYPSSGNSSSGAQQLPQMLSCGATSTVKLLTNPHPRAKPREITKIVSGNTSYTMVLRCQRFRKAESSQPSRPPGEQCASPAFSERCYSLWPEAVETQ